jgi:hypothetical protein
MSEKLNEKSVNRRNVLKGLTAGTASIAAVGVGSANKGASGEKRPLSPDERAELRAPFENLEKARSAITENSKQLLAELGERGYLPSASANALQMNQLATGVRKKNKTSEKGFNDVRVKAMKGKSFGKKVVVDTKIRHRDYVVRLSVSTDSTAASALVYTDEGVEAFLKESDDEIEDISTSATSECGGVCDDCCGVWDWTEEHTVTYDCPGSCQTACGCLVAGVTYCCEQGCGTLCTC